ncbi:MAG: HAD-IB family hydrolase [Chlamydiae bacterium]|nr:HAD-IB family hydrolase [Chlamydiota bacterium]
MQVCVFDLDRTLIKSNSSFQFCLYLYQKKIFSCFHVIRSCLYYIQHRFLGLSLTELHEKTFKSVLKGMSLNTISMYVKEFVDHWLIDALYIPAICELRRAQHLGYYTLILSNSPSFLVKVIAERLNVTDWKGTEYEVDKDGKLCHIAHVLNGKEKASQVRTVIQKLGLTKNNVTAYSDSVSDLPLLESAGQAVVVNPDRKLKRISQAQNWPKI